MVALPGGRGGAANTGDRFLWTFATVLIDVSGGWAQSPLGAFTLPAETDPSSPTHISGLHSARASIFLKIIVEFPSVMVPHLRDAATQGVENHIETAGPPVAACMATMAEAAGAGSSNGRVPVHGGDVHHLSIS